MELKELLMMPKLFVEQCQEHLNYIYGAQSEYNFSRYINEELTELITNHKNGNHENNRTLLVDDIIDSCFVICAALDESYIEKIVNNLNHPLNTIYKEKFRWHEHTQFEYWLAIYNKDNKLSHIAHIFYWLINLSEYINLDWQHAFTALCEENMSKLPPSGSSEEFIKEIYRDGKCNKKDPQGKLYYHYKPANFDKF